jgi:hypothetical protein
MVRVIGVAPQVAGAPGGAGGVLAIAVVIRPVVKSAERQATSTRVRVIEVPW